MFKRNFLYACLIGLVSQSGFSELDPELAATQSKHETGFRVESGIQFGQATPTSGGAAGLVSHIYVEPGFQFGKDSWTFYRGALQIGAGSLQFTEGSSKVTLSTLARVLARFGYGSSIGTGVIGIFGVGFGPFQGTISSESNGVTVESESAFMGTVFQLGYDLGFEGGAGVGFHLSQ